MKIETIFVQGLNKEMTFWIGTSKEDNDKMIDNASPEDIWFHANNISSCHVICKIPDNENISKKDIKYIIKKAALLCKTNTNKLKSASNIEFVYCSVKHLTKTNIVGCVSVSNGKYVII
jgi:predicted ribosome quality control (RQC) complex YloA/Tae2 family protein